MHLNMTSFTDDKCATAKEAAKTHKLGECKKGAIYACSDASASGAAVANVTSFNDDTCTSFNSSKVFDSGVCTATGPKAARTSKLLVCY